MADGICSRYLFLQFIVIWFLVSIKSDAYFNDNKEIWETAGMSVEYYGDGQYVGKNSSYSSNNTNGNYIGDYIGSHSLFLMRIGDDLVDSSEVANATDDNATIFGSGLN